MGGGVRIRIHCRRRSDLVVLLTLALLTTAILGVLSLSGRHADASPSSDRQQLSVSPRRYYLTGSDIDADDALTACATGYHMAALWEIFDATDLRYDSTLGYTLNDSGSGPPTGYYGWVRTGRVSASSTTPGQGNCYAWTTINSMYSGTRVRLPTDWAAAGDVSASWEPDAQVCNDTSTRVWCVADYFVGGETYLPNVLKSY